MAGWFKRWFADGQRKPAPWRPFRPALEALEERLVLNTYTVINTNPSGIGSLPYEYGQAQSGDTINFSTLVNGQTIDLVSSLRLGLDANGEPNGKTNLTIDGSGVNVTLSGGNNHRIIEVAHGSDTIKNLTFTNGKVTGASGGAILVDSGAGLTLNNDTFTNNSAVGNGANGGAIENDGNLTVASSYFYGNSSAEDGAAIDSNSGGSGSLAISTSDFDGNNATGNGGAISTSDSVTLRGNQFAYNTAGGGGGAISTSAQLQLQSTSDSFENNTASGGGGAISTAADTTLTGDTFQANTAAFNGGAVNATAGIRGTTSLTVNGSTFTGNQSTNAEGGAIYTTLITSVQTSTFNNNHAAPTQAGGAIEYAISNMNNPATPYDSSLQLSQDMFSGNFAVDGGAVSADIAVNSGLITVSAEDSTFYQNTAQTYGGAFWYDSATSGTGSSQAILVDDTFFQNSASDKGGGLGLSFSNAGTGSNTAQLTSLTVYQNNAVNGGGGVYVNTAVQGGVTVTNNIFDGNLVTSIGFVGPEDVAATNRMLTDTGYNLVGTSNNQLFSPANNDILNDTPSLAGSLAANGAPAGYPPTLALVGSSPALGTGNQSLAGKASPLGTDARGFIRQAGLVSIGAEDPLAQSP